MLSQGHIAQYSQRFGDYLYHCTPAENLEAILREGLGGPSAEAQSAPGLLRPGAVYLCTLWTAVHTGFDEWGDAVLSVPIAALDGALFVGDADNYRDGTGDPSASAVLARHPEMDQDDEVAAMLLQDSGTVAYAGPVPPEQLAVAIFAGRPDLPHLDRFLTAVAPLP